MVAASFCSASLAEQKIKRTAGKSFLKNKTGGIKAGFFMPKSFGFTSSDFATFY
jgi:hypothetical protein